jgi:hypothetical protein
VDSNSKAAIIYPESFEIPEAPQRLYSDRQNSMLGFHDVKLAEDWLMV